MLMYDDVDDNVMLNITNTMIDIDIADIGNWKTLKIFLGLNLEMKLKIFALV